MNSNTPMTVNRRQAATMLGAVKGDLLNPFLDADQQADLRECEGMLRSALVRITANERRIDEKRFSRGRA